MITEPSVTEYRGTFTVSTTTQTKGKRKWLVIQTINNEDSWEDGYITVVSFTGDSPPHPRDRGGMGKTFFGKNKWKDFLNAYKTIDADTVDEIKYTHQSTPIGISDTNRKHGSRVSEVKMISEVSDSDALKKEIDKLLINIVYNENNPSGNVLKIIATTEKAIHVLHEEYNKRLWIPKKALYIIKDYDGHYVWGVKKWYKKKIQYDTYALNVLGV
jgi:hypothetical protein